MELIWKITMASGLTTARTVVQIFRMKSTGYNSQSAFYYGTLPLTYSRRCLLCFFYHPSIFADFSAASSNACLGSLMPYWTSFIACLMCSAIDGYSGIVGLPCPN